MVIRSQLYKSIKHKLNQIYQSLNILDLLKHGQYGWVILTESFIVLSLVTLTAQFF